MNGAAVIASSTAVSLVRAGGCEGLGCWLALLVCGITLALAAWIMWCVINWR